MNFPLNLRRLLPSLLLLSLSVRLFSQLLDTNILKSPPTTTWGSVNGDYTGQRNVPLTQINATNVKSLGLAWAHTMNFGPTKNPGIAAEDRALKSAPLMVKGVIYLSNDDRAWAIDALTGREIWRFDAPGKITVGTTGNRGMAMLGDWLFFTTPDNSLISISAKDGKERWKVPMVAAGNWFTGSAPTIIHNHVIVGPGSDDPIRGHLDSYDPETGKQQWRWYSTPDPGTPDANTWANEEDMLHGGGTPWMAGSYDPELNLYYFGTGDGRPRNRPPHPNEKGEDSLYTASIVALNPDTGKIVWHFQPTPHDIRDYDNVQIPILFDGEFKGQKHKFLAQASRNGYFFLLDRATGKNYLTAKFMEQTNWAKEVNAYGIPVPNYEKDDNSKGVLTSPYAMGATNWWVPAFDPKRGLFFVNATRTTAYSSQSGRASLRHVNEYVLEAIDYKTGKIVWTKELGDQQAGNKNGPAIAGIVTTSGDLLFSGDSFGNIIAVDPGTGKTLWHANLGQTITNAPIVYELDGREYVLVAAVDQLFAFALSQ